MTLHDLPRDDIHRGALRHARRRMDELAAENARLRKLVMSLAERLANASEVLGMLAEKKEKRNQW